MVDYRLQVNLEEISNKLGVIKESIAGQVRNKVEQLSISTHAFILRYAKDHLKGWQLNHFLGENSQNVRWVKVGDNIWVVEIDPTVAWLEEGRDSIFMDWLLKNGKTAKDGSKYASIPFKHISRGTGGIRNSKYTELTEMIKTAMKNQGIPLTKIERDAGGSPKLGILHRLNIPATDRSLTNTSNGRINFFSKPRSEEMATKTGLRAHGGIHFLENAVVIQREKPKRGGGTGVSKEVVTFRTISSKHEAEGRWFYPQVRPLNAIPEAYKYAQTEWEKIVKNMESDLQILMRD